MNTTPPPFDCPDEFKLLKEVLTMALQQACEGVGTVDATTGLTFEFQPMIAIGEMLGSDHGMAQQVIANIRSAVASQDQEVKIPNLLDAIVVLAGMVVYSQRNDVHEVEGLDVPAVFAQRQREWPDHPSIAPGRD